VQIFPVIDVEIDRSTVHPPMSSISFFSKKFPGLSPGHASVHAGVVGFETCDSSREVRGASTEVFESARSQLGGMVWKGVSPFHKAF
jgi:hypothetical protein